MTLSSSFKIFNLISGCLINIKIKFYAATLLVWEPAKKKVRHSSTIILSFPSKFSSFRRIPKKSPESFSLGFSLIDSRLALTMLKRNYLTLMQFLRIARSFGVM